MARTVVPVMNPRLQTHGRIRVGEQVATRSGSRRPKALDVFRFTSPDRDAIDKLADAYGGTVERWEEPRANPPSQWQVRTEASEIDVYLPLASDPLQISWELWSGNGMQRHCDGETCTVRVPGPDGSDPQETPCICEHKGKLECKPKVRLSVLLPTATLAGVWRYESGSMIVAQELMAMEALLAEVQRRGFMETVMRVEKRQADGGTKKFTVVTLAPKDVTLPELIGGSGMLGIPVGAVAALPAGPAEGPEPAPEGPSAAEWYSRAYVDDDVPVDAEIVENAEGGQSSASSALPGADQEGAEAARVGAGFPGHAGAVAVQPSPGTLSLSPHAHAQITRIANAAILDADRLRHWLVGLATAGRTESSKELTKDEKAKLERRLSEIEEGQWVVEETEAGELQIGRPGRS